MSSGDATVTISAKDLTAAGYASAKAGLKDVGQAAAGASTGLSSLHGSLRQIDGVFAASGHSIGPLVQGIGDLSEASGKTAGQLGKLATAGLVFGAATAGWQVGRLIADFFDLDTKIGNATARLLGFGNVGAQVSGAKQDSINLAIKRGAAATTDYTAAIKFNTEWMGKFNTGAGQMVVAVKASTDAQTAAWLKAQAATKAYAESVAKAAEAVRQRVFEMGNQTVPLINKWAESLKQPAVELEHVADGMLHFDDMSVRAISNLPSLIDKTKILNETWEKGGKEIKTLGNAFLSTFEDLPNILSRAFEGGGGIAGAFHSIALQIGQDFGKTMVDAIKKQIAAGGSSMSGRTTGLAAGAGLMSGISAASSGGSTGQQVGQVASTGLSIGMMAWQSGALLSTSIALGAVTLGAGVAVIAIVKLYKAMNDGRKAMQDFYKTFAGGGDELRTRMLVLGDEGERLWKKLTQQTGKGDKAGAQAVIAEINAALGEAEGLQAAISAAGFKSNDELQANVALATKIWREMSESGKYSAAQVALAWAAVGEAEAAAASDGEKAQTAAIDAISAKFKESLDLLDTEYKSLSDSVAGEAEEANMGVVETQQRARMAQIEAEKQRLEEQKAAEIDASNESFSHMTAAAQTADEEIRRIFSKPMLIPVEFDYPGALGASSGSQAAAARARGTGDSGSQTIVLQTVLDGRVLAESNVRHQGRVLAPYGIH